MKTFKLRPFKTIPETRIAANFIAQALREEGCFKGFESSGVFLTDALDSITQRAWTITQYEHIPTYIVIEGTISETETNLKAKIQTVFTSDNKKETFVFVHETYEFSGSREVESS